MPFPAVEVVVGGLTGILGGKVAFVLGRTRSRSADGGGITTSINSSSSAEISDGSAVVAIGSPVMSRVLSGLMVVVGVTSSRCFSFS